MPEAMDFVSERIRDINAQLNVEDSLSSINVSESLYNALQAELVTHERFNAADRQGHFNLVHRGITVTVANNRPEWGVYSWVTSNRFGFDLHNPAFVPTMPFPREVNLRNMVREAVDQVDRDLLEDMLFNGRLNERTTPPQDEIFDVDMDG